MNGGKLYKIFLIELILIFKLVNIYCLIISGTKQSSQVKLYKSYFNNFIDFVLF